MTLLSVDRRSERVMRMSLKQATVDACLVLLGTCTRPRPRDEAASSASPTAATAEAASLAKNVRSMDGCPRPRTAHPKSKCIIFVD